MTAFLRPHDKKKLCRQWCSAALPVHVSTWFAFDLKLESSKYVIFMCITCAFPVLFSEWNCIENSSKSFLKETMQKYWNSQEWNSQPASNPPACLELSLSNFESFAPFVLNSSSRFPTRAWHEWRLAFCRRAVFEQRSSHDRGQGPNSSYVSWTYTIPTFLWVDCRNLHRNIAISCHGMVSPGQASPEPHTAWSWATGSYRYSDSVIFMECLTVQPWWTLPKKFYINR